MQELQVERIIIENDSIMVIDWIGDEAKYLKIYLILRDIWSFLCYSIMVFISYAFW